MEKTTVLAIGCTCLTIAIVIMTFMFTSQIDILETQVLSLAETQQHIVSAMVTGVEVDKELAKTDEKAFEAIQTIMEHLQAMSTNNDVSGLQ